MLCKYIVIWWIYERKKRGALFIETLNYTTVLSQLTDHRYALFLEQKSNESDQNLK